jgi:Mg2+/citrate symporter
MNPKALTGITIGSAIMFLFGVVWFLVGLSGGRFSPVLRAGLPVVGLALAAWIAMLAVRAAHVSRNAPPPTAEQAAIGRQIGRRFGWINGIQGDAIFLAIVALNAAQRPDFIAPAIALIVGLHFLPLAGLFQRPSYYVTGLLGCAIGVAGLLIPEPSVRQSTVGLSFGLLGSRKESANLC